MKLEFIPRACPLCGGDDFQILAEATIDEGRLTDSAFASRKLPEYMHSRMVECHLCGMLYADPMLRPETLADAYRASPHRLLFKAPRKRCHRHGKLVVAQR
jgi:hypothetical protein